MAPLPLTQRGFRVTPLPILQIVEPASALAANHEAAFIPVDAGDFVGAAVAVVRRPLSARPFEDDSLAAALTCRRGDQLWPGGGSRRGGLAVTVVVLVTVVVDVCVAVTVTVRVTVRGLPSSVTVTVNV